MGTFNVRITPDTLRSIDSATLSGSYQAVGTALTNPARIIKFTNNSTSFTTISWDGVNDHEVLPAGSFTLLDVSANKEVQNYCEIAVGTTFYVKGSAGVGSVYVSVYYAF
jgi:hypothetical protein